MGAIIQYGLQVPVVEMSDLTIQTSTQYLCILRGDLPPTEMDTRDRLLMGLFYAGPPCNLILIQEGLADAVRNYILAHELAHFIADIFMLRRLWLKSG